MDVQHVAGSDMLLSDSLSRANLPDHYLHGSVQAERNGEHGAKNVQIYQKF